jgi:ATP/maltotriose-dependent transcriptional regulator MalT
MVELSTMIPPHAAAESDLLLATKLHVPWPRADFLARSRLVDRLKQGADVKLSW